jgi:hypothetical protein
MPPGFIASRPFAFCLLPIFTTNPINFYPVKYFVEIELALLNLYIHSIWFLRYQNGRLKFIPTQRMEFF